METSNKRVIIDRIFKGCQEKEIVAGNIIMVLAGIIIVSI